MDKGKIDRLTQDFLSCSKILTAIGDETRQHLIIEMMKIQGCKGSRVTEITERTALSRPAVSHHLQILKEAGIISVRKEGTKNYYYFNREMESLQKVMDTLLLSKEIAEELPKMEEEQ